MAVPANRSGTRAALFVALVGWWLWGPVPGARADTATAEAVAATFEAAEEHYVLHCRGCHRPDGHGMPDKGVPDLHETIGRLASLPGGRAYLVRVPGTAQAPIDDAAVAALLNWMLDRYSTRTLPADFAPYTAEEVARYRVDPLLDATAERQRLGALLDAAAGDTRP